MSELDAMKKTLHFAGYEVMNQADYTDILRRIAKAERLALHRTMTCGHARFYLDDDGACLRCAEDAAIAFAVASLRRALDKMKPGEPGHAEVVVALRQLD